MKKWSRFLLLAVVLTLGAGSHAQTWDESFAAFNRKDYSTALAGFSALAEKGNIGAQGMLGMFYQDGLGVQKSDQHAVKWYRKAAEKGSSPAQFGLAEMYAKGLGLPKDEQQAAVWYRKSAEQGFADAEYELGLMYASGRGLPMDERQAVVWFKKAAEQDDVRAKIKLGEMYYAGQGVSKDDLQVVVWAGMMGFPAAQFTVGQMYATGKGLQKDEVKAVEFYRNSATQGNASAQLELGYRFDEGKGVPKDARQAVTWFRKAADQDLPKAQYALGVLYGNGQGVTKDEQEGIRWFRKAAEQGHGASQKVLGARYALGSGVPKDEQMGYFWFLLASANGVAGADGLRDGVERNLTKEQRASAQTAARNWQPRNQGSSSGANGESPPLGGNESTAPGQFPQAPNAPVSTGSGFRVASNLLVTNHHVIDGCTRLHVNGVVAQVRGSDARSDLALLGANTPGSIVKLRAQRIAVGEFVSVAGYPLRGVLSGFNMTTGSLSSLSGMGGDTRLVQITAPVQPGNSGGPMLDAAGNLMGVVVSKLDAIKAAKLTGDIPQNVNFAINANVLRSFLDANSVDYDAVSSEKVLPTTVVAEKAKGFTVLVECWK